MSFFMLYVENHTRKYTHIHSQKNHFCLLKCQLEQRLTCFPKTVCIFIDKVGEKMGARDDPEQKPKFIPINVEKVI